MLQLNHVRATIDGRVILNDVSVMFQKGKKYVIQGRSGSGKTTLLNTIIGYNKSYEGSIIKACGENNEAPRIAYMMQDDLLFSNLTVMENLMIAKYGCRKKEAVSEDDKTEINDLLKSLQMEKYTQAMVRTLSGGERKRVFLIATLLKKPDLLLMDEPITSLDPVSCRMVLRCLRNLPTHVTVIIASHEEVDDPVMEHLTMREGKLYYA